MGLMKKKGEPESQPVAASPEAEAEGSAGMAETGSLPAEPAPEAAADPLAAAAAAGEEAAADPLAGGADALLNMFQTTQAETEDRSVILELAGEVELGDLLEELQTVALAIGCAARPA